MRRDNREPQMTAVSARRPRALPTSTPQVSAARSRADALAPLYVDLDGTLVAGDTLWESFAQLVRRDPRGALRSLFALPRGRAAFKRAVAERIELAPSTLVFNDAVLGFVRSEAARGRPVVLATAADARVAQAVARHLGCFDAVVASVDGCNLKGARKLAAIEAHAREAYGSDAFDYLGDSRADRPIWRAAGSALVVCGEAQHARRVAGKTAVARTFSRPAARARDFLRAMRLHQWVKNILVFAPIVLSHTYFQWDKLALGATAFFCFGLAASATYLWNDILDLPADRAHARKRERPIAAGRLGIPAALAASAGLLLVAFGAAVAFLPPLATLMLAGYIALTVTYSLALKEKLLVDAMMLGLLYAYRILFGAASTAIAVSDWLIAFSVFFFFGLALVKRYSEISTRLREQPAKIAGRGYYTGDREVIGVLGIASNFTSVLILALYITSPAVVELYRHPQALWGVCLVMLYWLSRVWVLCHRGQMPDDPIVFAVRDRISISAGGLCLAAVLAAKF